MDKGWGGLVTPKVAAAEINLGASWKKRSCEDVKRYDNPKSADKIIGMTIV